MNTRLTARSHHDLPSQRRPCCGPSSSHRRRRRRRRRRVDAGLRSPVATSAVFSRLPRLFFFLHPRATAVSPAAVFSACPASRCPSCLSLPSPTKTPLLHPFPGGVSKWISAPPPPRNPLVPERFLSVIPPVNHSITQLLPTRPPCKTGNITPSVPAEGHLSLPTKKKLAKAGRQSKSRVSPRHQPLFDKSTYRSWT